MSGIINHAQACAVAAKLTDEQSKVMCMDEEDLGKSPGLVFDKLEVLDLVWTVTADDPSDSNLYRFSPEGWVVRTKLGIR